MLLYGCHGMRILLRRMRQQEAKPAGPGLFEDETDSAGAPLETELAVPETGWDEERLEIIDSWI